MRFRLGLTSLLVVLALTACSAPTPAPEVEDAELQSQLDDAWERFHSAHPDVERPAVEVIRTVSLEDVDGLVEACVSDEGFPNGEFAAGQEEALALAYYVCQTRYPLHTKYNRPWNDEKWGYLYDYFTNELVPCLEAQGYTPPVGPSRQVFIDTEQTGEGWWFPYEAVPDDVSGDDWTRLNEACPQVPLGVYDL